MLPGFLFAKITDIGLVTIYYFLTGVVLAGIVDRTIGKFDETQYKGVSTLQLTLEIGAHLILLSILAYVMRNLIGMIPFPLEGFGGFRHAQLKEIDGGIMLSFILVFFQSNLTDKIDYFNRRVIQGQPI
jgi:hypothetical protein